MPVFAILDPQRRTQEATHFEASIGITLGWLDASLTDRQLQQLAVFSAKIAALVRQRTGMHGQRLCAEPFL